MMACCAAAIYFVAGALAIVERIWHALTGRSRPTASDTSATPEPSASVGWNLP